jgi:hypothetical protein
MTCRHYGSEQIVGSQEGGYVVDLEGGILLDKGELRDGSVTLAGVAIRSQMGSGFRAGAAEGDFAIRSQFDNLQNSTYSIEYEGIGILGTALLACAGPGSGRGWGDFGHGE